MGRLCFSGGHGIDVDDRLLHHLEIVTQEMLQKHSPFPMTLTDNVGQVTLWVTERSTLTFTFDSDGPGELDAAWLANLRTAATSQEGIVALAPPLRPL